MKYFYKKIGAHLLVILLVVSCTDLSNIETDINSISQRVTTLESLVSQLQNAYDTEKKVVSVDRLSEDNGWLITFSDQQSISLVDSNNDYSFISSVNKDENNGIITLRLVDGSIFEFNLDTVNPTGLIVLCDKVNISSKGTCIVPFIVNPSNAKINTNLQDPNCSVSLLYFNSKGDTELTEDLKIEGLEPVADENGEIKAGLYHLTIKDSGISDCYSKKMSIVINTTNSKSDFLNIKSSWFTVQLGKCLDKFQIGNSEAIYYQDFIFLKMPTGTDLSNLKPTFVSTGKVFVNGVEQVSGVSQQNFYHPVQYMVSLSDGSVKSFIVYVSDSKMPILRIETSGKTPITSKDEYRNNTVLWTINSSNDKVYTNAQIKGRGNSTWVLPKKGYTLKLEKKDEFLGLNKHKSYALIANYSDKTLIRNEISYSLGRDILTKMSWNPSTRFVHLVLNNEYQGIYMVSETAKIDKTRINIPNIEDCNNINDVSKYGFLLEVNDRLDGEFNFSTSQVNFSLKDPSGDNLKDEYKLYIESLVRRYEGHLYSANFNISTSNDFFYHYFDVDSFIDWWLVNEISKNVDGNFHTSCFMYLDPSDQKLHMAPLWDFDIAFGNLNFLDEPQRYTGWWVNQYKWLDKMFADPAFVAKVKKRWVEKKTEFDVWANQRIQEKANSLKNDVNRNFNTWPILGTYVWPNPTGYAQRTTYQSEVDFLIEWVRRRIDWMDSEIRAW